MFSKNLARPLRNAVFGLAVLIVALCTASQAQATSYSPGWIWDSWEITNGPANTGYYLEGHHWKCGWQRIRGVGSITGTTDASGNDSGWLLRLINETGLQPYHDAVRARFTNGTILQLKVKGGFGYNRNVSSPGIRFTAANAAVSAPLSFQFRQNTVEFMNEVGQAMWFQNGSAFTISLPQHFTFANVPDALAVNPVDLLLGPPVVEKGGQMLFVPVLENQRMDPLNGIVLENVTIAYNGIGIPFEYRGTAIAPFVVTPVGDPFTELEVGEAYAGFHLASVLTDPAADWFDETNGGKGYADFDSLVAAQSAFLSEAVNQVNLEDLEVGEKLADQYLHDLGIYFSGADGGPYNNITGIAAEGDPFSTEDLTGYDGTYQPDGSQVYLRFQNTVENPDAPFTIHFTRPQRTVAAFLACGVQGSDHSFTVTAYDGSSEPIDVQQVTAELWEDDPTGQNYETLFAVNSAIPNIRSVSIVNNSTVQFADALTIDTIEFGTSSAVTPGDTNFDGLVNVADLLNLLGSWGECPGECPADLDGDGTVGVSDLLVLLGNWGP